MKKLNLLRLIASLCLFLGTFITFVNTVTEIPTVLPSSIAFQTLLLTIRATPFLLGSCP